MTAPVSPPSGRVGEIDALRGIAAVKPGATTGDIGHAIQSYVEPQQMSVVRDFCGHGLGRLGRAAEGNAADGFAPGRINDVEETVGGGQEGVAVDPEGNGHGSFGGELHALLAFCLPKVRRFPRPQRADNEEAGGHANIAAHKGRRNHRKGPNANETTPIKEQNWPKQARTRAPSRSSSA